MSNNDLKRYILVKDGQIASVPMGLTINYKNINSFCLLSDSEVSDLSWAGYNDEGFWLVISDPIPALYDNQVLKVSYIKDDITKTFRETFSVSFATDEEILRLQKIRSDIRNITQQYFDLTIHIIVPHSIASNLIKTDIQNFHYQLGLLCDIPDITQAIWPIIPTSDPTLQLPPFPDMSVIISQT